MGDHHDNDTVERINDLDDIEIEQRKLDTPIPVKEDEVIVIDLRESNNDISED